jgi:NAD(P)-dependent dehydrogenase (short-subunit alcohol dehydrogenase family)
MHVVVTGANRGIGLEFVRQYLSRGDRVTAGCRDPESAAALRALAGERLAVHACDVSDDARVEAFARAVGDATVDLLINNAGVGGEWTSLDALSTASALHTYSVNALGPLRVTRALLPHLLRGPSRRVVHVSSGMGSIGDNTSGGAYAYRMSKAALNMASRSLAVDLRDQGVTSVVINPGWVQTDMGGAGAPVRVEDSVAAMITRFDHLTLADSGRFLDWKRPEGFVW